MAESMQLGLRLTGPAGLRGAAMAEFEAGLLPALAPAWESLGEWYTQQAKDSFARKHGRSGVTAEGSVAIPVIPNPVRIVTGANFGGHVGFVVSPLPSHKIRAVNAPALGNPLPHAPGMGRTVNQYGPFGPVKQVDWYQGGPQSHGPDTSWIDDVQPALRVEAAGTIETFGRVVQAMASERFHGARVVYRTV